MSTLTVRRKVVAKPKKAPLTPAQKREVKKIMERDSESKWAQGSINGVSIGVSPTVSLLTLIPQGSSVNQRTGDRVKVQHLELRYRIVYGDNYNYFRVIIFQWHPVSVPLASDILNSGVSGDIDPTSMYNPQNSQQYSIILDKQYDMTNGSSTSIYAHNYSATLRRGYQKLMTFSTTAGVTSTNCFYMLAFSDSIAVAHPAISLALRTVYTDE